MSSKEKTWKWHGLPDRHCAQRIHGKAHEKACNDHHSDHDKHDNSNKFCPFSNDPQIENGGFG